MLLVLLLYDVAMDLLPTLLLENAWGFRDMCDVVVIRAEFVVMKVYPVHGVSAV